MIHGKRHAEHDWGSFLLFPSPLSPFLRDKSRIICHTLPAPQILESLIVDSSFPMEMFRPVP